MSQVITRFPPSPTGHLHLGGARTALFNWLFARRHRGKFILRFEDTDRERSKPEYVNSIMEALKWLGLNWDEGPYFQSERLHIYHNFAHKLWEEGKAYYCECSKELLEEKKKKRLEMGLKPGYDQTCRSKNLGPKEGRVLRLKVPEIGDIVVEDLLRGKIIFSADEIDDFILLRSDGTPTYHFAVVVDDIEMKITHVIRGDDHLSNTPKQILIYKSLGVNPPYFAHIPMVLGPDGARLSKRHGARSVLEYREEGYLPFALINYLARLGWGYGDEEYFSVKDLIEKFSLEKINLAPARFDPDKLLAVNAYWIKNTSSDLLLKYLQPFLKNYSVSSFPEEYLISAIDTVKPRTKTLKEMVDMLHFYLVEEIDYEENSAQKYLTKTVLPCLEKFLLDLKNLPLEDHKLESYFKDLTQTFGIKLKDLAQAIRVSLTGRSVSPGLFEIIRILGKERVERRLKKALEFIKNL